VVAWERELKTETVHGSDHAEVRQRNPDLGDAGDDHDDRGESLDGTSVSREVT
jgi:hypothetical protein